MRTAAGVILIHDSQVFLLRRSPAGSFFPGYHAFTGGALEPGDSECGLPPLVVCALRELFEEAGVWLGPSVPGAEERRQLLAGTLAMAELLERYSVSTERLLPAGLRVTPDYSPVRFQAQFYLVEGDFAPEVWPGELQDGDWWSIEAALAAWERAEIALAPPTLGALRLLREHPPAQAAERLQALVGNGLRGPEIPLAFGLSCLPMETPTLPPARHTVCCLVGGDRILVVDPGGPVELEGRAVEAVVLTHHHVDHIQGAAWARAQGIPLAAHPETASRLEFPVQTLVEDGHRWDLGRGWEVEALHTPGHAPGHLALWNAPRRILLAGDLVSGASTIVIDPPEGNMAQYLASLDRMRQLEPRLVVPAHGMPFGPGSDVFGRYLRHRLEREARVVHALAPEPRATDELLAEAYADTPEALWPVAARSLLAHLLKLEGEGRALRSAGGWAAVAPAAERARD